MKPTKTLTLAFGALAPPLVEQLMNQKVSAIPNEINRLEEWRRQLTGLRISGILSDAESRSGEKRLMKRITAEISKKKGSEGMSEEIQGFALKSPDGKLYLHRISHDPDRCFVFGDAPKQDMLDAGYSVVPVMVEEVQA